MATSPSSATPATRSQEPPASARGRSWSQTVIATGVVLTLCYVGEIVLVVMLVSVLLAFILAPIVDVLCRIHLPRSLAALVAVLLLLGLLYGGLYLSYNQGLSFLQDLPKYSGRIRAQFMRFTKEAENFNVLGSDEKGVVRVRATSSWSDLLTRGFGSFAQTGLALSFIPFLVYFMLSWQQHVRSATVMLFPMEYRHTAYTALGLISSMIRSFMVGNLLVGLFMSVVSTAVFGYLGLPFFYFVGILSGFLSLVPYMGVILAMAPPVIVGLGQIGSQEVLIIVLTVFALHIFTMNVLYPKFLGNRLQLNPLAVTIALLFWGWLWGGAGLLLAIPITAAMKIVVSHIESLKPYGAWLGE